MGALARPWTASIQGMGCIFSPGKPAARPRLRTLVSSVLVVAGMAAAQAQTPQTPAATSQKGGSFYEPPADVPSIYLPLPRTGSAPVRPDAGEPPLSLQLSADF